jgi:hypothetical protein
VCFSKVAKIDEKVKAVTLNFLVDFEHFFNFFKITQKSFKNTISLKKLFENVRSNIWDVFQMSWKKGKVNPFTQQKIIFLF